MSQVERRSSEDTLAWVVDGNRVSLGDLTGLTLGDFLVERLLGRGGMGEVYLATQLSLNRPVALKVLRPDFLDREPYLSRFNAEAASIAKLNHPSIVHVYALGCIDEVHFIAMEYVEGTNLREYIRKKGALDLPLAFSVMRQTGQAIGAAGEVGLIHRDIKPENILMTRKGRVKVADFGLCRDKEVGDVHLTQSGTTLGTPLYMSPEQAQGHAIDHRSDLYSLGVTFYHMLAGEPPFRADSAVALALKHVREAPRSIRLVRPDLPEELDRLVLKLMDKDPAGRYQSASEMVADLTRIREAHHIASTAAMPEATYTTPGPSGDLPSFPTSFDPSPGASAAVSAHSTLPDRGAATVPDRPVRMRWGLLALAGMACLAVGVAAGWAAREPDVQTLPTEPAAMLPVLWLDSRWTSIPQQHNPQDQLRYAQFRAPREDWVAAWLAVPGHYPHSPDAISKAYTQLARIWYRSLDVDALSLLESELSRWKEKTQHDDELINVLRIAIHLRKGDLSGAAKEVRVLTRDDVADMYDPALVDLSLEITADGLAAVQKSGPQTLAEPFLGALKALVRRLYRLEVHAPAAAKRAGQGGGVASKIGGPGGG